jgi:tRNA-splicing ligase RtcB
MFNKMTEINKIDENLYEIKKHGKMNVPIRIFSSEKILDMIKKDKTLEQAENMAKMPGVVSHVVVLPDAHQGYGACIGGVSAYDSENGVVSPGQCGYDINCGVRLLTTNISLVDFEFKRSAVLSEIYKNVPSGIGESGKIKLTDEQLDDVLNFGSKWAVENGFGISRDLQNTEDSGCIKTADASKVTPKAKARGRSQLGTLGAGNHFLEIQKVDEIFDKEIASAFGLKKDQIVILIHTGSRGLGHQTASDYIQKMERLYGFKNLPDRELACAPINSQLGKDYLAAMAAAANFAFANRQIITHKIRESFKKFFPKLKIELLYDVAHNIAKFEPFDINGKKTTLCVHRKGATRSFGPGRLELPEIYRKTGQPILIPGSMGTFSYVLVGTKKAEKISFASTAHGAGRVLSRTSAKANLSAEKLKAELKANDIEIKAGSIKGLLEEAPEAYKDVNEVVRVSHELGIGNLVARLKPLAVMKG